METIPAVGTRCFTPDGEVSQNWSGCGPSASLPGISTCLPLHVLAREYFLFLLFLFVFYYFFSGNIWNFSFPLTALTAHLQQPPPAALFPALILWRQHPGSTQGLSEFRQSVGSQKRSTPKHTVAAGKPEKKQSHGYAQGLRAPEKW